MTREQENKREIRGDYRCTTYGFKLCRSRYLHPWISRQMTSSLFIAVFHSQPGRAAAEHVPEQHLWATTAKQSSSHIHTPPDTESRSKKHTLLQKQKENKYTWHCSEREHLTAAL